MGFLHAYHPQEMTRGADKRTPVGRRLEPELVILTRLYRAAGGLGIIIGVFDDGLDPSLLQPDIDLLATVSGVLDNRRGLDAVFLHASVNEIHGD